MLNRRNCKPHVIDVREVQHLRVQTIVASKANQDGYKSLEVIMSLDDMKPRYVVTSRFYNPLTDNVVTRDTLKDGVDEYNKIDI